MKIKTILRFIIVGVAHFFLAGISIGNGNLSKLWYYLYMLDSVVIRLLFFALLGAVAITLHSINAESGSGIVRIVYLILGVVLAGVYRTGCAFYMTHTRNILMVIYSNLIDYPDFNHALLVLIGALIFSFFLTGKKKETYVLEEEGEDGYSSRNGEEPEKPEE